MSEYAGAIDYTLQDTTTLGLFAANPFGHSPVTGGVLFRQWGLSIEPGVTGERRGSQ